VVVGGFGIGKQQGFRYTEQTGLVGLGFLSAYQDADSIAAATNRDGSVVVGTATDDLLGDNGVFVSAYRVQVPGSLQRLELAPGWASAYATGVSADAKVIVGFGGTVGSISRDAVRWTESAGLEHLGDFSPTGVSADGKVVVGYRSSGGVGEFQTAVRWTKAGPVDLGVAGPHSIAAATNANGSIVVGQRWDSGPDTPRIAFRWTKKMGVVDLPPSPGDNDCGALALSVDGSVTVGECNDGFGVGGVLRATIWDKEGARSLASVLQAAGADLQGMTLTYVTGVSANGKAFCGWGHDPNGLAEAWLARLP
jgi:uncharacterized membrane protein